MPSSKISAFHSPAPRKSVPRSISAPSQPAIAAAYQTSPLRRATAAYLSTSPARPTVSSQVVGTAAMYLKHSMFSRYSEGLSQSICSGAS